MKAKINKVSIQITHGDLLSMPVTAIVNDTDTDLMMEPRLVGKVGIGVQRELALIGYCEVGAAVITSAGNMGVEKIIHTVGPRWGEGSERGKLSNAVFECLRLAELHKQKSIAFPAISTGTNGYPLENCAKTMLTQIIDYTFEDLKHLRTIILCLNSELAFEVFRREFQQQLEELKQGGEAKVQA
jgi:O-acetyl-ADP-ribose deacetylase (regulator of RNase III)